MARITTTRTSRMTTREIAGPGIGAGVVAAVVMGLFAMIVSAAEGAGFWTPMQLIGALYLGPTYVSYGAWSAILGIGTHLVVGAIFGVVFAALIRNVESRGMALGAGLAYGAIVFLGMTYLVLPWADPVMYTGIDRGWFFIEHLSYGLVLPLALPARHAIVERRDVTYRRDAYSRP